MASLQDTTTGTFSATTNLTSPKLLKILSNNPHFNIADCTQDIQGEKLELKWVSQMNEKPYSLHTMQRFSSQLGFMIDPTNLVNLYDESGKIIKNEPKEKIICINLFSKERERRFIPQDSFNIILSMAEKLGYKVEFIGDCGDQSDIQSIEQMLEKLKTAKLFIGPVSFCYHLAAAIDVNCLTFFSYMPYWKFSHFSKTTPIYSSRECVLSCEEKEQEMRTKNNCFHQCLATTYDKEEIEQKLIKLLS